HGAPFPHRDRRQPTDVPFPVRCQFMNVVLHRPFGGREGATLWAMGNEPDRDEFVQDWNALPRQERLRVRRLVRLGRPLDDRHEAALAVAYARFQRSRVWARLFWLWFVPGVVLALAIASSIHPILIGVVLALAAQAVLPHRN